MIYAKTENEAVEEIKRIISDVHGFNYSRSVTDIALIDNKPIIIRIDVQDARSAYPMIKKDYEATVARFKVFKKAMQTLNNTIW